ncbi:Hsp20/alpha crystallin family protein [Halorubellus sp. PRR65]|uniref:Hsp20/alpha crystallin family protein n=1 Tax=Halorubellus sp. PRR65 TaxID=3098148 RepID=UPI002B25B522|nr:Hsp20/alpha crystallin family protein [Halorubellus sp. PRR65]
MERTFDSMWMDRTFGDRTPMLEGRTTDGIERTTSLHEEDDMYVFVMDLPGFETDEIDLVYHDGHLEISAVTETSEESEQSYVRHSRSTTETVSIPGEIDVEGIEASYHNGVLEVTLPTLEGERDLGHDIDIR